MRTGKQSGGRGASLKSLESPGAFGMASAHPRRCLKTLGSLECVCKTLSTKTCSQQEQQNL
eukprot:9399053-Lingulodinium_polyedra.AAC.1